MCKKDNIKIGYRLFNVVTLSVLQIPIATADIPKDSYDYRIQSDFLAPVGFNPTTNAILEEILNFETNTTFSTSSHEAENAIAYAVNYYEDHYNEREHAFLTLKLLDSQEVSTSPGNYYRKDTYEGTFSGSGGFNQAGVDRRLSSITYEATNEWNYSYHLKFTLNWSLVSGGVRATWLGIDTEQPFTADRKRTLNRYDGQGNLIEEWSEHPEWTEQTSGAVYENFFRYHIVRTHFGSWKMFIDHPLALGVRYEFDIVNDSIAVPEGGIRARLRNAQPNDEYDGIDRATINIYKQDGFVRDQLQQESAQEYDEYLRSRKLTQVGNSVAVTENSNSMVEYTGLDIFDRAVGSGPGAYKPSYYTIIVTNPETQEIDLNHDPVDPAYTVTTIFSSSTIRNVRPTPIIEDVPLPDTLVDLLPADVFVNKLAIIEALGAASPDNYAPIEFNDALPWVTGLKLGAPTDAQIEGLKRMLWAERVVRDGYIFADQAAELMLGGMATIFADIFDDMADFTRNDISFGKSQIEKIRNSKSIPNTFYDKSGLPVENYLPSLGVDKIIKQGEKAGMVKELTKTVKLAVFNAAEQMGMDTATARSIADHIHQVIKVILSWVQSRTLKGAAKPALKELVAWVINQARPLVMDGTTLGSYAGQTKGYLQFSVDKAQEWNALDPALYLIDRSNTVATLREMGEDASSVIGRSLLLQGMGSGLDDSQDAFALVGRIPPLKALKVAEKVAMFGKYLSNTASIVEPAILLGYTLPNDVERGTLQAYGMEPSQVSTFSMSVPAVETYARNSTIYSELYADTSDLKDSLSALQLLLQNNEIEAAILKAADNSLDFSYSSIMDSMNHNFFLFQTRLNAIQPASNFKNIGDAVRNLIVYDTALKAAQIEFITRLRDFFVAIDLAEYTGVEDPMYQLERDALAGLIPVLTADINNFRGALYSSDLAANNQPLAPVIAIEILSVASNSTGLDTITGSPETFSVSASITNLGATQLTNLAAELKMESPLESMNMDSSSILQVGEGVLDPGQSTTVIWQVSYNGDFSNEMVQFELGMLENATTPITFDFNEPEALLIVDPEKSDKDGDYLPDDWELSHGISIFEDSYDQDPDEDGLSNYEEYRRLTNPIVADTDKDQLSDGEEVTGGTDGFQTDPLNPDTDGDGADDSIDGQPLDASTTEPGDVLGDGFVNVSANTIVLTSANRFESVMVTNLGNGPLTWTARVEDDAIAAVMPAFPNMRGGEGELQIIAPYHYDFSKPRSAITRVSVEDVAGSDYDNQIISVLVIGDGSISDSDNDSVPDLEDAFPLDPLESTDWDGDGIGDYSDPDDDNDGLPDSIEQLYFLNPLDPTDAGQDLDHDQFTNLEEYLAGTKINDFRSVPYQFYPGYVYTGEWLGWLYIELDPWFYSSSLENWLFMDFGPDGGLTGSGVWMFVSKQE